MIEIPPINSLAEYEHSHSMLPSYCSFLQPALTSSTTTKYLAFSDLRAVTPLPDLDLLVIVLPPYTQESVESPLNVYRLPITSQAQT